MRLELLVGNDEPHIYPLSKPKLILGSHESCDIVINHQDLSRKHLAIISDLEKFYLIDQGSSNGSYVNNERLVPGQKVEFTSFFPVRLGTDVIISLLSDEEASLETDEKARVLSLKTETSINNFESSTRLINLKDLKSAKTEKLYSEKKQAQTNLRKKKISDSSKKITKKRPWTLSRILPILIVIGAFAMKFDFFEKIQDFRGLSENKTNLKKNQADAKKKIEIKKETPKDRPVQNNKDFYVINKEDFTSLEKLNELKLDLKCTSEAESFFCGKLPILKLENYGAYQRLSMVHLFLPGQSSYEKALNVVMKSPNAITAPDLELAGWIRTALFLSFIKYELPAFEENEAKLFNDLNITFIISYNNSKGVPETARIVLKYVALVKLKSMIEERHIDNIKSFGIEAVDFTKDFFLTY